MTMKLCLSDIYVEWHKMLKGSYSGIENLQDYSSWNVMVTDTTKIYYFVPDRNVLWCEALDEPGMQTVFFGNYSLWWYNGNSVSARVRFLRFWRNKLTADALTVCLWVFRDLWKINLHTNIFARYFHDVSDLFQKRRLRMSKVICDSHRWGFVPNNFRLFRPRCYFGALCSINFEKSSLEKKVFFAPIHQNI